MTPQSFSPQLPTGAARWRLVEEINHRVFNEYSEAISSLSLAATRSSCPRALEALAFAAARLRAHAATHRALLPPTTAGLVDLAEYMAQICASLSQASLADQGVRISLSSQEIWLDTERCWTIGLILTELVRNAARHGLKGRAGLISIQMLVSPERLSCLVHDNGPEALDAKPGRGRGLIEGLACELAGSVDWWFTPFGCVARLQLPMERAAETRRERQTVSRSS